MIADPVSGRIVSFDVQRAGSDMGLVISYCRRKPLGGRQQSMEQSVGTGLDRQPACEMRASKQMYRTRPDAPLPTCTSPKSMSRFISSKPFAGVVAWNGRGSTSVHMRTSPVLCCVRHGKCGRTPRDLRLSQRRCSQKRGAMTRSWAKMFTVARRPGGWRWDDDVSFTHTAQPHMEPRQPRRVRILQPPALMTTVKLSLTPREYNIPSRPAEVREEQAEREMCDASRCMRPWAGAQQRPTQ